ncbi:hypothetical protein SY83_18185 [Paenibacillus swuensis]|uniref:Uncharacterized protein n=2 Tax=Paenibacillus swuensis TaxID=1178515 RepID=A0A172TPK1_9BACL|nr:hypothetical protein SY83_18185 [Paenibacillus swuensis]
MLMLTVTSVTGAPQEAGSVILDDAKAATPSQLEAQSAIIALGKFEPGLREYPTLRNVPGGKLVNYVQKFRILKSYKGTSVTVVNVINTGVFPRPATTNPLNLIYPGAFAENEDYIVFLKPISGTNYYSIAGILQGIYPIVSGRSIAFEGFGFKEFQDLPLQQMEQRIRGLLTR